MSKSSRIRLRLSDYISVHSVNFRDNLTNFDYLINITLRLTFSNIQLLKEKKNILKENAKHISFHFSTFIRLSHVSLLCNMKLMRCVQADNVLCYKVRV